MPKVIFMGQHYHKLTHRGKGKVTFAKVTSLGPIRLRVC